MLLFRPLRIVSSTVILLLWRSIEVVFVGKVSHDHNKIAQMANVFRATVSRYLNDGYVSEEKCRRIAKVIGKTEYVPSPQARMLRTGKTKFVGVVIPKISSESIGRGVAGISSVLGASDYRVLRNGYSWCKENS
ncbi:MAG: LacI family DNA-binding transcriptional regulator [Atopobiaceae bacterium]|jgi:transcriptional regulator with XRE-family HTH domain|nr:LacI family DNA-binding transcriptional regulator [Olegusella sp.]NLH90986.1 LacI family transcriptional regulator [Atopobium sp.]